MKIPQKLEAMVADLISDETKKREEIEGILSQIHELTEPFFNPAPERLSGLPVLDAKEDIHIHPEPEFVPQELSDAQRVENFTKRFIRKGMPPDMAREKAEEECGLRDGRI